MSYSRRLLRIFLNTLIPIAVICLVIWGLPWLLGYFAPFAVGALIALIANPLVRLLEKRIRLHRKFGTVLIIGGALAIVVIIGYAVISWALREGIAFIQSLPGYLEEIGAQLEILVAALENILPENIYEELSISFGTIGSALVDYIAGIASNLGLPTIQVAGNFARSIPSVILTVVITILSAYFFLAEKDTLLSLYHRTMPKKAQEYVIILWGKIKNVLGGYFLAQFKLMVVVASVSFAGLLILRVSHLIPWTIVIAVLDFVPVVGAGTVLIPWALIELITGQIYLGIGLFILYLITVVVRQSLQPKLVGDSMGINPLLTLFFLYLGYRIGSIAGMIVAVPLGILVIELYKMGAFDGLIGALREFIDLINEFRGNSTPARSAEEKINAGKGEEEHE